MSFDIRVKILKTGSPIILNYSQLKFPENEKKFRSIIHLVFRDAKIRFDPSTTLQFRARDSIMIVRKSAGWSVGLLVDQLEFWSDMRLVDWPFDLVIDWLNGGLVGQLAVWSAKRMVGRLGCWSAR